MWHNIAQPCIESAKMQFSVSISISMRNKYRPETISLYRLYTRAELIKFKFLKLQQWYSAHKLLNDIKSILLIRKISNYYTN